MHKKYPENFEQSGVTQNCTAKNTRRSFKNVLKRCLKLYFINVACKPR